MNIPRLYFHLFLISGLFLFQGGCASIPLNPHASAPSPRPEIHQAVFSAAREWTAQPGPWESDRRRVTLIPDGASPGGNLSGGEAPILVDYFPCLDHQRHPGLLISPILGGRNRVADHFAQHFARHGYHCAVVHRPRDLTRDIQSPGQLDERLRMAVIRDRVALDWLSRQPEVDPGALGSFGISYGGIKNTVLAGVDRRLKANVIALAGGDLPSILSHSNLPNLRDLFHRYAENNHLTPPQAEQQLRAALQTEPLRFTPYIDPRTTLLILARMDHTVPRRNGELLREALGYPRTIYLPTGHYSAVLFTGMAGYPYIESKVLDFLDRILKDKK
ncbi:MAG: alpha/beta hydrolase family protein [bacterium]